MRYLGMHPHSHRYWINLLSQSKYQDMAPDCYNQGPLVDELEERMAELLGKPSTLFFNKGVTCQLAALKVHCEQANNAQVLLHPQSHIAQDEHDAYQALMGLKGVLVGQRQYPLALTDLKGYEDAAVLVIELPLRRAGFKLPDWQTLLQLRQWCDAHQTIMHMDGARLWESAPYYQKSFAEVAKLFDSVYVSLYKGIGAINGAVLAGSQDFIKACQVWRSRLGSEMWSTFPTLITALEGMDQNLPEIPNWVVRANEIAAALKTVHGLTVDTPQTNGFQVRTEADCQTINQALKQLSDKMQLTLCKPFADTDTAEQVFTEIQVGASHDDIKTEEIVDFFGQLIDKTKPQRNS